MKLRNAALTAAVLSLGAGAAFAQTAPTAQPAAPAQPGAPGQFAAPGPLAPPQIFDMGANPPGTLFHTMATAVSKVARDMEKVQLRIVPSDGPASYLPMIDGGQLAFGITNGPDSAFAYAGTATHNGKPHKNIRQIGALFPVAGGFAVRTASTIRTVAELKGQRLPSGFALGPMFNYVTGAVLASEGLSMDDVTGVPTANFVTGIKAFVAGEVDAAYIPLNAGLGKQAMTSIAGGWRYVTFEASSLTAVKISNVLPSARHGQLKPGNNLTGVVDDPTSMLQVDFVLVGNANVSAEGVYLLVKALHRNKSALVRTFGAFRRFKPADMAPKHPTPYHPGAIKYFREVGIWKE